MTEAPMHPIAIVSTSLHRLASAHPEWWMEFEDGFLDHPSTPTGVLLGLLERAPNSFAVGLIAGRLAARGGSAVRE